MPLDNATSRDSHVFQQSRFVNERSTRWWNRAFGAFDIANHRRGGHVQSSVLPMYNIPTSGTHATARDAFEQGQTRSFIPDIPTINVRIPSFQLGPEIEGDFVQAVGGTSLVSRRLSRRHIDDEALQPSGRDSHSTTNSVTPDAILQFEDPTRRLNALEHLSQTVLTASQVALPTADLSEGDRLSGLLPMMPEDHRRYIRDYCWSTNEPSFVIQPFQQTFMTAGLPDGWKKHVTTEGKPFFFNEEKQTLTDEWIYDHDTRRLVTDAMDKLRNSLTKSAPAKLQDSQLVLQLNKPTDTGDNGCSYYFANHAKHLIFWAHEFDIGWHLCQLKGDLAPEHVEVYLFTQFWQHFEYFSAVQPKSPQDVQLAFNCLIHALADKGTSETSTVSMSEEQLEKRLALLEKAHKHGDPRWLVGRYMNLITTDWYFNFYNQRGARLCQTDSVYGLEVENAERSFCFRILSACLAYLPERFLQRLEKLWVDERIILTSWTDFHDRMTTDQKEVAVFSALVLTVNMGLLDIDTVDQSLIRIISYISTFCAFASLVTVLLVIRHCRHKKWTLEEAFRFLRNRYHCKRRFERLALAYSLPGALLAWSIILLLSAFSAMCFTSTASDTATRIVVGVTGILIIGVTGYGVWMFWENDSDQNDTGKCQTPTGCIKALATQLRIKFMALIRRKGREASR